MSEKENDYGLDGSAKDFSTYIDGDKLDPQSALLLERELQNDEQNLPVRLKLLFYYSQDHVDNVEPWVSLMLWMVKNRPKDWLSGNLQKPCGLSEAQFLQIKEQWTSVINSNLDDADIIGRAGQFISGRTRLPPRYYLNLRRLWTKKTFAGREC